MNIGVALGIGTMTAAALGNVFADVVGLNLGGLIEEASHRMGIPEPKLSKPQLEMGITRIAAVGKCVYHLCFLSLHVYTQPFSMFLSWLRPSYPKNTVLW